MVVAGVVIETLPGRAREVAIRLAGVNGLRIAGGDGDSRLAAVIEAGDARRLEEWAEELLREDGDVLGILPTFVGDDAE